MSGLLFWAKSNFILQRYKNKLNELEAYIVVAYNDKNPIGWSAAQFIRNKPNNYIISIFVKEQYRNKNIGSKIYELLQKKIKIARKEGDLYIIRHTYNS